MTRKILNLRLYHRVWPVVCTLATLTLLSLPDILALTAAAIWQQDWALVGDLVPSPSSSV